MAKRTRRPAMPAGLGHAESLIYATESAAHAHKVLGESIEPAIAAWWRGAGEEERAAAVACAEWQTQMNCGWAEYRIGRSVLALAAHDPDSPSVDVPSAPTKEEGWARWSR